MPYFIIAQIFGVGAMVSLFWVYQQSERKKLIAGKLCADVCWVVHYFLIKGYGGMITNGVGVFRELTFMNRDKYRFLQTFFTPLFFIAVNFFLGISTFSEPIHFLPLIASALVTVSLWLKKPKLTKIILLPVCTMYLVYNIIVHSWVGAINESASICSIIISFIKEGRKTNEE